MGEIVKQWQPGWQWDGVTPCLVAGMPFDQYAEIDALNGSLAKEALRSVTKAAYYRQQDRPRTEALLFGTAYHTVILEFDRVPEVLVSATDAKGKEFGTGSTSQAAREWIAQHPQQVAVNGDDMAALTGMRQRLERDGGLPGEGWLCEVVVLWVDDGVPCKARIDGLKLMDNEAIVLELKSTRDASYKGFQRQLANLGYHVSAAHYVSGVLAATGIAPEFYFLAQEKEPPHDYLFVKAATGLLLKGEDKCAKARDLWKRTQGFNDVSKVEVVTPEEIDLPRWALGDDNEVTGED